jgi:hypothetical protein
MTFRQFYPQDMQLLGVYETLSAFARVTIHDLWAAQNRVRRELEADPNALRRHGVCSDQRPARLRQHLADLEGAGLLWVGDGTIHLVAPHEHRAKSAPRTSYFTDGTQAPSAAPQGGDAGTQGDPASTREAHASTQNDLASTHGAHASTQNDRASTQNDRASTHTLNDCEGLGAAPSRAGAQKNNKKRTNEAIIEGGGESSNLVTHARDPAPTPTSGMPEVSPGEPQAPEASPRGQPDSAPSPEHPPPKGPALPSGVPPGSRLTAEVWAAYQAAVAAGNEAGGKLEIRPYTAGNVAAVLDAHPSVEPLAAVARLRTDLTGKLAPKGGRSAEFGDGSENLRRICEWTTRDGGHVGGKPRGAARPAPGQGIVERGRPDLYNPLFGKPSPLAGENIDDVFGDRAAGS